MQAELEKQRKEEEKLAKMKINPKEMFLENKKYS